MLSGRANVRPAIRQQQRQCFSWYKNAHSDPVPAPVSCPCPRGPVSALAAPPEQWEAVSTTALSITGNVRFSTDRITFQNGKLLPLEPAGIVPQFGEAMGTMSATLYRVTKPDDPSCSMATDCAAGEDPSPSPSRRLETRPCCKRHRSALDGRIFRKRAPHSRGRPELLRDLQLRGRSPLGPVFFARTMA